jgi:hypothetical protein
VRPLSRSIDDELAAVAPLPSLPWPAPPPVAERGRRARMKALGPLSVQIRLRPHRGMDFSRRAERHFGNATAGVTARVTLEGI